MLYVLDANVKVPCINDNSHHLAEDLLCTQPYAKHFTDIALLNPHINFYGKSEIGIKSSCASVCPFCIRS